MIKVPYLQVSLYLDMSTTNIHTVPPHEFALLSEMYGNKAKIIKTTENVREVDPQEEYARLGRRYGINKESKRPWVEEVFGRFSEGRLEATMKKGAKHYLPEPSPQQKAAKTRAKNKATKDEQNAVAA